MWLVTAVGFFSVVQKPGDSDLTVRARVEADLEALRAYVPEMGPTTAGGGTDYQYRAKVGHEALAAGVGRMVLDIGYSNFKGEIARRAGHRRAHIYSGVWATLASLEKLDTGLAPEED
jgi:hypothetical protein